MLTEVVELPSAVFDSVPPAGDSGPAPLPAVLPLVYFMMKRLSK